MFRFFDQMMANLLPCLEDEDQLQSFINISDSIAEFGNTTDPVSYAKSVLLPPLPPSYDAIHRTEKEYLSLDLTEVEQFFETIVPPKHIAEDHAGATSHDLDQEPNSPFFGRTTPLMFNEEQARNSGVTWTEDFYTYGNQCGAEPVSQRDFPTLAIHIPEGEGDTKICYTVPDFQQLGENIVSPVS
jgi:hypothetical protein